MNFSIYWQHADAISKTLYFVLLAMSIATWCIFILRVMATRQAKNTAVLALTQSVDNLKSKFSALSTEQRKVVAEQALLQQMARSRVEIERGLPVLGTIASIAPFVGLFGTVWGIFHALVAIGNSGQAGLAQVAAPVGEALIMTGLGLAVAIPAVLAYNICTRMNRVLIHELHDKAHSVLIENLLPGVTSQDTVQQHKAPASSLVGGQA
ncbi:biopolymer transporter ExbB [Alkanindiges hydrocarboniclasticus]|jgi:biopolymer transport protein ExbB|uniref:Biopolymer transport protein ExbB n=1 Tax=Alkanindiges hydrocarboniclasticus TaxID=1907941 RepID=A0A1S8CSN1_9GAMM|nr:MotA/TolQ/ExbB proton channel family protein [Alkanindiges hydrocarboniclasticus]ONG38379.1 biopolymer transporter ExbB [Alkanindiges hydrocarboniclasticus]